MKIKKITLQTTIQLEEENPGYLRGIGNPFLFFFSLFLNKINNQK